VTDNGPAADVLARLLWVSDQNLRDAERRVEEYLTTLFPNWRGWVFKPPDGIEVYQVLDTDQAAELLHRQGFRMVTLHSHRAERYLTCGCRVRQVGK
jgi:hypothetical protein